MPKQKLDVVGVPLIVENHPSQYEGFPFITYIQFHNSNVLAIIDNVHNKQLQCYVLDLCKAEQVNETTIIRAAMEWYDSHRQRLPLSVYLNQLNLGSETDKIYKTFNIEFITRIVGPLFTYPIHEVVVTKRKKRKPVTPSRSKVVRII